MNPWNMSGRTLGRMIANKRGGRGSSEKRGLRSKTALRPHGKARFPLGKYHPAGTFSKGGDT